jgi:hypothetical protein
MKVDFTELVGNTPDDFKEFLFLIHFLPIRTVLFISYTSSNDETVLVPCEIVEDRYKVKDRYKVTMKSIYEGFGQKNFYQSDLMSLIQSGSIKVFRRINLLENK